MESTTEPTFSERLLAAAAGNVPLNPAGVLHQAVAAIRTATEAVEAADDDAIGDYVATTLIRAANEIEAVADELHRRTREAREGGAR